MQTQTANTVCGSKTRGVLMNVTMAKPIAQLPVINLGTLDRDLTTGQFVTTYVLRDAPERHGIDTVIERTLPAASIERIGVVVARGAERGMVWDIEATDRRGADVTFDFACFSG